MPTMPIRKKAALASLATALLISCQNQQPQLSSGSLPVEPDAGPAPNSTPQVLAESADIRSGLQAFSINQNDQGLILWNEGKATAPTNLQGRMTNQGSFNQIVAFDGLVSASNLAARYTVNAAGLGTLSWNTLPATGTTAPALYSLTLQNTTLVEPAHLVGNYRLHDQVVDPYGNGFAVASLEQTGPITDKSPLTQVLRLPMREGKLIGLKAGAKADDPTSQENAPIPLMTFHRDTLSKQDPFVLAAKINIDGDGLIIYAEPSQDRVNVAVSNKYNVNGTPQILEGLKYSTVGTGRLTLTNGRGAFLTSDSSGNIKLYKINDYTVDITPQLVTPPKQSSCAFGDYPPALGWDYTLDSAGNGYLSWLDTNRSAAVVQRIRSFKLEAARQSIKGPNQLDICMTRIQTDARGNAVLAGLSTACPNQTCGSDQSSAAKMVWISRIGRNTFTP